MGLDAYFKAFDIVHILWAKFMFISFFKKLMKIIFPLFFLKLSLWYILGIHNDDICYT